MAKGLYWGNKKWSWYCNMPKSEIDSGAVFIYNGLVTDDPKPVNGYSAEDLKGLCGVYVQEGHELIFVSKPPRPKRQPNSDIKHIHCCSPACPALGD